MKFTTTLIRRTVVSLSAIAALIVTGYAASQSVELRTNGSLTASCTYSSMTVSPNGGVVVACGTSSTTGPGTFTITGPTSLATSTTTAGTTVKVSRSGGSTGAVDVSFTATGACTSPTVSPLSFADGDSVAKPIVVAADAAPGVCQIGITPNAGTTGGTGILSIQVVDPNADVTFAMSNSNVAAQINGGAATITATRTGGTNGTWSVPVTLSGGLAPTGTLPGTSGTVSGLSFNFAANSSSAIITYTPPAVMPAASDLTFTLQTPAAVGTPIAGQNGLLGTVKTTLLTLSGAAVGCPAYAGSINNLGAAGTINHMSGSSPYTVVYSLPVSKTGVGVIGIYSNSNSPTFGPAKTEVKISKCPGDFTDQADGCYQSNTVLINQQMSSQWANAYNSTAPNAATFVKLKRCLTQGAGPWYINVRTQFPSGACTSNQCGFDPIWKLLLS